MTVVEIAGRYDATYREPELRLICSNVQRGRSTAFVGVSGVGKSNLINFLSEGGPATAGLPGLLTAPVHFAIVECNRWQETPASLWELLLESLEQLKGFPPAPQDPILSLHDATRNQRRLQSWTRLACHEMHCHLVFVLDHFDHVLECGPLSMLEDLGALRNDGNRDRLSYLIFTNRLPHVLGRSHDLEARSKFYDLFRRDVYALEPHQAKDALKMLAHLNEACQPALSHPDLHAIYHLAGGHARLLKVILDVWVQRKAAHLALPVDPDELQALSEVNETCRRILLCLHEQEQRALLRAARDRLLPEDLETADHLVRRGLLQSVTPPALFSPVLTRFLWHYGREGELR